MGYVLITEKRRLAIAAAAIVQRIVSRRRPRVFLPVLPLKNCSALATVILVVVDRLMSSLEILRQVLGVLELRVVIMARVQAL